MYGWAGKVLRVDLTRKLVRWEELAAATAKDWIGARGLGMYYLLAEVPPTCDPLGPENKLILAVGPLTGTAAPTGARYAVVTRSPLTGAVTCSNAGGQFPAELKSAGLDAVIIEGQATEPLYLWIGEAGAELRAAEHLWGLDTHQTHDQLVAETDPKARVACIGPAGERRVRFAAIMNDRDRAAGRSGVGAVMGAKNLKAVVVRGTTRTRLHDEERFRELCRGYRQRFADAYPDGPPPLRAHGTAVTVLGTQTAGVLPTRNFQSGQFDAWREIYGETLTERFLVKPKACFSCPIACGRQTRVEVPGYEGEGEGPEYETVYAFGSNCEVGNLAAVTKANYLCNELGLDTITMGATIACAMELAERGYLPAADVGRTLRFGDAEALVELTHKTAFREGFGDLLAEGSLRLAERYGHPELAMVAKGQEFAGYDPRGAQGMGLAYATSPIGASHMRGDPAYIELLGVPLRIDPLSFEDKAELVVDWQDAFAVIDAAGLCVFFSVRNLMEPDRRLRPVGILELLNAATGAGYTLEELLTAARRIINAERLFLVNAGFSAKDDTLPPRMLVEPMPAGPAQGMTVRLDVMLPAYYALRGWDADGRPRPEILLALGLGRTPAKGPEPSKVFYRSPGRRYPVADRAEGVWIWDGDGNRYLDGAGGAGVVTVGHGVREVVEAMGIQAGRVAFAHGSQFTTAAAEELACRVAALSDDPDLDRVYFVSTGSEAVETAVKLCRQYWLEVGQAGRYKVVSRWTSYHGNTAGALALGGHTGRRGPYLPLLQHTPHIEPCYCYRCPYGREPASCGLPCADALERTILYEGPESVAAFIAEPVGGATAGVLVPPAGYWPRIRQICDRYGVLLIADEVMVGVGRTGRSLCLEHWGVTADIVALAKLLSSGYAPLGAVLCRRGIHAALRDGTGSFVHGFTYNQHPPAMAAGNAVLRYLDDHRLVERSARLGRHLLERLETLRSIPAVGDVRGLGLFAAVELVADRATGRPFEPDQHVTARVVGECFRRGLIVYPATGGADGVRGDAIVLCPPYIIEEAEIDRLAALLGAAVEAVVWGLDPGAVR